MALALDGTSGTGQASSADAVSLTGFSNSTSGSSGGGIIVIFVHAEWLVSASVESLTSVTVNGQSATKRSANQFTSGAPFNAGNDTEVWWYFASTPLSSVTITATWPATTTFDCSTIAAISVKGFLGAAYQANPWDANASLGNAGYATNATGSAAPSIAGISTTFANGGMLLSLVTSPDNVSPGTIPSGFTAGPNITNAAGGNNSELFVAFEPIASAQSSITETWGTAPAGWIINADALALGSAAAPPLTTITNIASAEW